MLGHEGAPGHPERPERLAAILDDLRTRPVAGTEWRCPRAADWSVLGRAHDGRYLERLEGARGSVDVFDFDTVAGPGTVRAAEVSAGCVIDAVDALMTGERARAFGLCRPPGHHAEAHRAMGFCFFSNVCVGALHAIAEHGAARVMVIDWDVHHGNGTQHILEGRSDVLFVSLHEHPLFPGTGWLTECGEGEGAGFTVNVPMPAGCGDGEYLAVMEDVAVPLGEAYRPELVLVSAGFDAHANDPLGGMAVSDEGFGAMCGLARGIAERHAGGRIALALEGGYDLAGLVGGVRACVEDLAGAREFGASRGERSETARMVVERVREAQGRWWEL